MGNKPQRWTRYLSKGQAVVFQLKPQTDWNDKATGVPQKSKAISLIRSFWLDSVWRE
jgi:hypothetical protein